MNQLVVVGVDYRHASTRCRAALVLDRAALDGLIGSIGSHGADGFVQIATCNRTMWVTTASQPTWVAELLRAQMVMRWRSAGSSYARAPSIYTGPDAVRYLMRVAVGLESFAMGERQVAGQVHAAFDLARAYGSLTPTLNMLENSVGRVVRSVGRNTHFHGDHVGVHGVVAERLAGGLDRHEARLAVVGMGEIGRKVADTLEYEDWRVERVNRSVPEGSGWTPLAGFVDRLCEVDAVVLATGATTPLWTPEEVAGSGSTLIVDIGSPAQSPPALAELPGVERIDLDALLCGSREGRDAEAIAEAEGWVVQGAREFGVRVARRSMQHLVGANQRAFDELAGDRLANSLTSHGLAPGSKPRRELEAEVRKLFREYSLRVLDAVEALATGGEHGS